MLKLNQVYRLKEGFGTPDRYLGSNVDKFHLGDGKTVLSMTCIEYLCGDIKNVYSILEGNKAALKFFGDGHRPYPSPYSPGLDVTYELYADLINRFQQIIGVIRWSIELGRIEINTKVSCLYQHLCSPRKEHLKAAYKTLRYIQNNL